MKISGKFVEPNTESDFITNQKKKRPLYSEETVWHVAKSHLWAKMRHREKTAFSLVSIITWSSRDMPDKIKAFFKTNFSFIYIS